MIPIFVLCGMIMNGPKTESAKLIASDATNSDHLGYSVSISSDGNTVIVGAYLDDNEKGIDAGCAYIFNRSNGVWVQEAKLLASDGAAGDRFGSSVAISGDGNTVIVGAYANSDVGTESGSVYIFFRNGTTWSEQAKLLSIEVAGGDRFGHSVAISGDGNTAVISSIFDDDIGSNSGAVFIFSRTNNTWTEQTKILSNDIASNDTFGSSVAISNDGNTIIVGANGDDVNRGGAYIFIKNGTTWTQQAKLLASDGITNDYFGSSVSISGDGNTAIVGSNYDDDKGSSSGSSYIYTRIGTTWSQQHKLVPTDGIANALFGTSVSISNDNKTIVVGAYGDNSFKGSAYIYNL